MQAERGKRNGFPFSKEIDGFPTIPSSSCSSLASSSSSSSSPLGANYIEHRVSKMDTLAGVAIKYGVEVADIRRMNGLVTDLQMFAHKSLQIPLPGRHPPSPILSNGSAINGEQTPPRQPLNGVLDSFQSLRLKPPKHRVSSAMSSLHGYYGLAPPKRNPVVEGTEMAVYRNGGRALYFEDAPMPRDSPLSDPLPNRHRKSRSLVNGLLLENGCEIANIKAVAAEAEDNREGENSIRRRQKADGDSSLRTPEVLLMEDTSGGFSGRTGKTLNLRPKSGSRTDMDVARVNAVPIGDLLTGDGSVFVRKSSSTSNLQDSESSSSSMWQSSKWALKPDSISWPIYDGLPKPTGNRRNKAAMD